MKRTKKLALNKETLRKLVVLDDTQLKFVAGGVHGSDSRVADCIESGRMTCTCTGG